MTSKELFQIWAPMEYEKWTKFAKPALFIHASGMSSSFIDIPLLPDNLVNLEKSSTAIIVDLPGTAGVENGLALAKQGYIPVPLYNGIHENKIIGGLENAVDNTPIINALQAGSSTMDHCKHLRLFSDASPAFLLDSNRAKNLSQQNVYDNRWSIDIDDMPPARHLASNNIRHVIVWSNGQITADLFPILDSYYDAGIAVSLFSNNQFTDYVTLSEARLVDTAQQKTIPPERKEAIKKFENARVVLMILMGVAAINLVFQFFIREAPLFWTVPTMQWLPYLWVSEFVGDIIAISVVAITAVLYFATHRKREIMTIAAIFYGADIVIFFIYVLYYGLSNYMSYSMYDVIIFGLPILAIYSLRRGVIAQKDLQDLSESGYYELLDIMDEAEDDSPTFRPRRRHFRGFRGYHGYGGSGRGGFGGSGYRGYGGGYGGGFGG